MMALKSICIVLFISTLLAPVHAVERRYIAPLEESQWQVIESSRLNCVMQHDIPHFGSVEFSQAAGRSLRLSLTSSWFAKPGVAIEFRSESTHWNPSQSRPVLAQLKTGNSDTLFNMTGLAAEQAYLELHEGYQPGFVFFENDDSPDQLMVSMSTVRFLDAEAEFDQCVSALYHVNFEDIRFSNIHFDFDNEFPRQQEEDTVFSALFAYLEVDDSIQEFIVSGHADHRGENCYNDGLSARRAWYVYDLLVAKGIDPKKIRVEFYGENQPLRKGKSELDMAANRRVAVEVRRQEAIGLRENLLR